MRHYFSNSDVKWAFARFQELILNKEYRDDYKQIRKLEKQIRGIQRDRVGLKEKFSELLDLKRERLGLLKKWGLKISVNPRWKIKETDLFKTFQPGSTISKFFWAVLKGPLSNHVVKPERKVSDVSSERIRMDIREKKMLCYTLVSQAGVKIRPLARILKIDNKTVRNWVDDVDAWSESDKELVLQEMFSSKSMFRKIDALDRYTIPYQEL